MCPNCILNQASLDGGLYIAFGVCIVFFVVAIVGILWAFKNGEFEDMESTKFDMMDDEVEGAMAARARAAVEKARLKSSASS
ncbi:MAG TPA: cbb3-type cytochrome oxidase assembly protein [Oculatellaceae cyanobacterium]